MPRKHADPKPPVSMTAMPRYQPDTTLPAFMTIEQWHKYTNLSQRVIYRLLGTGELRAIKRGVSVLIDVQAGLHYLHSLPAPKIRVDPNYYRADRKAPREAQPAE